MATKEKQAEVVPAEGWVQPATKVEPPRGIYDVQSIGSAPKAAPRIPENWVGFATNGQDSIMRFFDNRDEATCRRVIEEATAQMNALIAQKTRIQMRADLAELELREYDRQVQLGYGRAKTMDELHAINDRLRVLNETKSLGKAESEEIKKLNAGIAHLSNVTIQRATNRLESIKREEAEKQLLVRMRVEAGPIP